MKTSFKKALPLATLAIMLFAVSPMASASTLTVNLNPKSGIATLDSVSSTSIVFTYPANSTISNYLRNASSSYSLSGKFDGTSSGTRELQGSFDDWDSHVTVSNISVSVSFSAKGNATALVINKVTDINATVAGAFTVVNGTVTANLGWRAFVVRNAMDLPLQGHNIDINLAGSAMENSIGTHASAAGWLMNSFGSYGFWNRPTLNFSQLDAPLSTWTKNYNAATNTTTFSKTISGQSTFSVQATVNGQKYSLSEISDPSGVINVQGYANASGDSLVMAPAPASASVSASSGVLAAAVVVGLLAAAGGYLAIRGRARAKANSASSTTLPV
jgi:hypothetical protein